MPTLEEYLEGRTLPSAYRIVYEMFIPSIASSETFKMQMGQRMRNEKDTRELYTKSDEAFTLLLLENYYDRWMDIYQNHGGRPPVNRGSRKKCFESKVRPKYTAGGNVYDEQGGKASSCGMRKGKGWDISGIRRYNELFDQVEADRNNHPLFVKR